MDFQRLKNQFVKYMLIGILNFGVQATTLNILSWLTGATKGWRVLLITSISTIVAITNSYVLNKLWTFKEHKSSASKATLFYGLTITGAIFANLIVYVITTYMHPMFGVGDKLWLNIANFISVGFSILWNFTAYTQVVFRTPAVEAAE
jgi:putative flippase GtrA